MSDILSLQLSVDVNNLENSLFQIYKQLRPDAEKSKIVFKELKGGFINLSYILYPENEIKNAIVFRTYGTKFNPDKMKIANDELNNQTTIEKASNKESNQNEETSFFDHSSEADVMNFFSKHNLCESVYARYLNGMCFKYALGVTVDGPLMLTNDFLEEMTKKLAKYHSIKYEKPNQTFKTHFEKSLYNFQTSIKSITELLDVEIKQIKNFPYNEYPKLADLENEIDYLKSKLEKFGMGEISFCHNDMSQKNIIWNPQKRKIKYIDFESSMNNYVCSELGFFFFSFCGQFLNDFVEEFLPDNNYRLKFIRKYLEETYKIKNEKIDEEVFEKKVNLLFIRSNIFLLILMAQVTLTSPHFDLKPDIFKVEETIKEKNNYPYACGVYGLKVRKTFLKLKDDFLIF